jgi:hypothetical protein
MERIEIEILRNRDCHVWDDLYAELTWWLRNWGLSGTKPTVRLITNDEEAKRFKFFGSPQLLVNGKDVDPMAEKVTRYHADGCRLYLWKGAVYEYPPKEMVEQAILGYGNTTHKNRIL